MKSYYPSRISIPLWLGIWGLILFTASVSLGFDISMSSLTTSPVSAITCFLILLLVGLICFGTGYYIKGEQLIIKVGPITERKIDIKSINSVERSYDLVASPANALKRLRINYKSKFVLISPAAESTFIKQLKEINPLIEVYNLVKTIKF